MKTLEAELFIPKILELLKNKEMYGYELMKNLRNEYGSSINWKEGCLYPTLKHMENRGLITSYWKNASIRPRKFYKIKSVKKRFILILC